MLALAEGVVQLAHQARVVGLRVRYRLAVEQRQDRDLAVDQLEDLEVVLEGGVVHGDALELELGLHARHRLVDEELLQPLVGEVDQQLLEAVDREVLHPEDVEQADLVRVRVRARVRVRVRVTVRLKGLALALGLGLALG